MSSERAFLLVAPHCCQSRPLSCVFLLSFTPTTAACLYTNTGLFVVAVRIMAEKSTTQNDKPKLKEQKSLSSDKPVRYGVLSEDPGEKYIEM